MSRGAFIVIEGVDRCGKTSQVKKLVESLRAKHIRADQMGFPDRTTSTGQIISKYLSNKDYKIGDEAIHLLFTANRWESAEKIKEQLAKGVTLVVDRYLYSGVAFSAAKGLNMQWCMQPEVGLPKPDLVFLLNIKPEIQESRGDFGKERYETSSFQKKVASLFMQFALSEDNWQIIDANASFDKVHSELLKKIEDKVKEISILQTPLKCFKIFTDRENVLSDKNTVNHNS